MLLDHENSDPWCALIHNIFISQRAVGMCGNFRRFNLDAESSS